MDFHRPDAKTKKKKNNNPASPPLPRAGGPIMRSDPPSVSWIFVVGSNSLWPISHGAKYATSRYEFSMSVYYV